MIGTIIYFLIICFIIFGVINKQKNNKISADKIKTEDIYSAPASSLNTKAASVNNMPISTVKTQFKAREIKEGYMNLNGKYVRIKDADKLEW